MPRVAVSIVLTLLGLAVVALVLFARGDASAEDALARHQAKWATDRAGLASIRRGRPPLVESALEGNAWDDHVAVVRALVPDASAGVMNDLPPGEGAARVPADGPLRARLRDAARRPCAPPPLTDAPVPRPFAWFDAHRVLEAAARDDLAAGRVDAAIDLWTSLAVLAADLERTTRFMEVSVAQGMKRRQRAGLAAVLASGAGTAASWDRLAATLDAADPWRARTPDVLRVLDVEMRTSLLERAATAVWPSRLDQLWGRWPWQWSPKRRAVRALERREDVTARLREIVATPMPGWRAAVAAVPLPAGTAGLRREGRWDDVRVAWDDLRVDAAYVAYVPVALTHARLVRVAVELAMYRASHGVLPPTLEDLRYLQPVPPCALTGQPLRYDAATGRVWSFGPDGDDDGGRPVPGADGLPDVEDDGDLAVTVPPPVPR